MEIADYDEYKVQKNAWELCRPGQGLLDDISLGSQIPLQNTKSRFQRPPINKIQLGQVMYARSHKTQIGRVIYIYIRSPRIQTGLTNTKRCPLIK